MKLCIVIYHIILSRAVSSDTIATWGEWRSCENNLRCRHKIPLVDSPVISRTCDKPFECMMDEALINGDRYNVKNDQLTASSEWDNNHGPRYSRLHFIGDIRKGYAGAWCVRSVDPNPFIQVDFQMVVHVTSIATQGRNSPGLYYQWVTSYNLYYSKDLNNWIPYEDEENNSPKMFVGNTDKDTVVKHQLQTPFEAIMVRLYPRTYRTHRSLRWEIYGCPK